MWRFGRMGFRSYQLCILPKNITHSSPAIALTSPSIYSFTAMFHFRLRGVILVLLGTSIVVFAICFSLAFAGGWVGQYAPMIEGAQMSSFFGCILFGPASIYLYRREIFKIGPTDPGDSSKD
jgi:hypothetical protein